MRDLSVQASNGGANDDRRQGRRAARRSTQLNAELDRIGETTAFGKSKLLDGSFGTTEHSGAARRSATDRHRRHRGRAARARPTLTASWSST